VLLALAVLLIAACAADEDTSLVSSDTTESGPPPSVFAVGGPLPGYPADGGQDATSTPTGCKNDSECDNFDPCTKDTCDRSTGKCMHLPVECEGQPCFLPADCDDEDPCTEDTCTAEKICSHEDLPDCEAKPCTKVSDCDDGDPCTQDGCINSYCVNNPSADCKENCEETADCDDKDPCTEDTCGDDKLCEHAKIPDCVATPCEGLSDCDDGDACTTDACTDGYCANEEIPDCTPPCTADAECNDDDACTTDSCDMEAGACKNEAVDCNDQDACTSDGCNPDTGCTNNPLDCDDANPCTTDGCDSSSGCTHEILEGECDDGDPCNEADVCVEGVCRGEREDTDLLLRFEEGEGAVALDWAGRNDGALVGNASFGEGHSGGGLRLPGEVSAAVKVPGATLNTPTLTFAAWVKPDEVRPFQGVISRAYNAGPRGLIVGLASDNIQLLFAGGWTFGGPGVPAGTWSHVAVTVDGAVALVYLNGVEVLSVDRPRPGLRWADSELWIGLGMREDGDFDESQAFAGAMDDVTWFNRAMSADEVLALSLGGAPHCEDGDRCTLNACEPGAGGCTTTPIEGCSP